MELNPLCVEIPRNVGEGKKERGAKLKPTADIWCVEGGRCYRNGVHEYSDVFLLQYSRSWLSLSPQETSFRQTLTREFAIFIFLNSMPKASVDVTPKMINFCHRQTSSFMLSSPQIFRFRRLLWPCFLFINRPNIFVTLWPIHDGTILLCNLNFRRQCVKYKLTCGVINKLK